MGGASRCRSGRSRRSFGSMVNQRENQIVSWADFRKSCGCMWLHMVVLDFVHYMILYVGSKWYTQFWCSIVELIIWYQEVSWGINRFSLVKNEVDWGELRLFERSWLGLMWFQEISWAIKSSCRFGTWGYWYPPDGSRKLPSLNQARNYATKKGLVPPPTKADLCQFCHCFGSIIRHHQSPALLQEENAAAQQAAVVPAAGPGEAKSLFKFHQVSWNVSVGSIRFI